MTPARTARQRAGVSNDIPVIDLEDMEVTRSVTVGSYPWGVAIKE